MSAGYRVSDALTHDPSGSQAVRIGGWIQSPTRAAQLIRRALYAGADVGAADEPADVASAIARAAELVTSGRDDADRIRELDELATFLGLTIRREGADMAAGPYGVRQATPATPGAIVCGTCGRAWDRDITPAGRCPWEDEHDDEPDRVSDADALDQIAETIRGYLNDVTPDATPTLAAVVHIIRSTGREV